MACTTPTVWYVNLLKQLLLRWLDRSNVYASAVSCALQMHGNVLDPVPVTLKYIWANKSIWPLVYKLLTLKKHVFFGGCACRTKQANTIVAFY